MYTLTLRFVKSVPLRRSRGQPEGSCDRQRTISLDFRNDELSRMISSPEKSEKGKLLIAKNDEKIILNFFVRRNY